MAKWTFEPGHTAAEFCTRLISENDFEVTGDLTIRGVTKEVTLDVRYLGQWKTPSCLKRFVSLQN